MAKIHLIGGEKGGVGKSVVARVVAQYLIDKELSFLGFDTDRSHGALLRFYADYASPVVVDRYESLDLIVESAIANPDKRILVDLAAQTQVPLVRWMDESGVLEMAGEGGFSLTYWHVMDSGKDSLDLLKKLLDRFGARREGTPAGTGRDSHHAETAPRASDQQDRRRQHEFLGGKEPQRVRQHRARNPRTAAGQDVARQRLRGIGPGRNLTRKGKRLGQDAKEVDLRKVAEETCYPNRPATLLDWPGPQPGNLAILANS
jgi:hypothetical protein